MQLAVARVDRGAVRGPELPRGDLAALEQPDRLLGRESQRVDHGSRTAPGRRDAEGVVVALGRVREHVLERQRRPRLVVAPDVHELERVRGRRHVGELELGHLRHGVEDRGELLAEALDLLLGQVEARELRDVQHLLPRDRHRRRSFQKDRGPFRGRRRLNVVPKG